VEAVREAGYGECHVYRPAKKGHRTWEEELEEVGQWLQSLSTPIGLLAANDARGVQVLDACQRIGLPVPEQCAVLGIDNQVIFCEFATPTLSSIDQDEVRNGFEAARLLDGLMAGKKTPAEPIQIPAIGIVPRASTDSIAVEDKELAMATCGHMRATASGSTTWSRTPACRGGRCSAASRRPWGARRWKRSSRSSCSASSSF
jgi:LacI family transcriptional regulator